MCNLFIQNRKDHWSGGSKVLPVTGLQSRGEQIFRQYDFGGTSNAQGRAGYVSGMANKAGHSPGAGAEIPYLYAPGQGTT